MNALKNLPAGASANDHAPVSAKAAARQQQRASNDLRRGEPVVLTTASGDEAWLILSIEMATAEDWRGWQAMLGPDTAPSLLLSGERASLLGLEPVPNLVPLHDQSGQNPIEAGDLVGVLANLQRQAGLSVEEAEAEKGDTARASTASPLLISAVRLLKRAFLLPAALVWPLNADGRATLDEAGILTLDKAPTADQSAHLVPPLKVSAARVPLMGAEHSLISVYRDPVTGRDINVIEVGSMKDDGKITAPPLVRIHAECFTGDLLNSLKCDCGDQLRGAIKLMAQGRTEGDDADENEGTGGLILYMPQEGRDIGMANKMRSYALQDTGIDTVDANLILGFAVDERDYTSAASILVDMGYAEIRLLTNNPDKVASLENRGVQVTDRVGHKFPPNPHSAAYMETKRKRTGHDL